MNCSRGHPLHETTERDLIRDEGYSGVRCDECEGSVSSTEPILHCSRCQYDLCSACVVRKGDSSSGMYCFAGHPLHPTTGRQLSEDEGYTGVRCDGCRLSVPPNQPILHCSECQFDLCSTCVVKKQGEVAISIRNCSHGHPLHETTGSYLIEHEGYPGVACDTCGRSVPSHEVILHCSECQYDLCDSCRWLNGNEDF